MASSHDAFRSSAASKSRLKSLLSGDAVHVNGFFEQGLYKQLLAELKKREVTDGVQKTYWQSGGRTAVTRVRKTLDLAAYPVHQRVVQQVSQLFGARVEGWWVNHYTDGSDVKYMHRDGWGRDRGVNLTIGASFGASRSLHFEAAVANAEPRFLDCLQSDGDVFAFGATANKLYKHGIPAEPDRGPRISVVVMAVAPRDWSNHSHATMSSVRLLNDSAKPDQHVECSPVAVGANAPRRRWGAERQLVSDGLPDKSECAAQAASVAAPVGRRWQGGRGYPKSDMLASEGACLVWLRDDLRLTDNPALHTAAQSTSAAVVPLFIHDTDDANPWPIRGAALWWKSESLKAFDHSLRQHCGSQLIIRRGAVIEQLLHVARSVGARRICFNRMVEPWYRERDLRVEESLREHGFQVDSFKGVLLQEPWEGSPPALVASGERKDHHDCWEEVCPGELEARDSSSYSWSSDVTADLKLPEVVSIINADRLLSNPNPCAQLLTAIGENGNDVGSDHRRRDPDHFLIYQQVEAGTYASEPLPSIKGRRLAAPPSWPETLTVEDLGYHRTRGSRFPRAGTPQCSPSSSSSAASSSNDWAADMKQFWNPGEEAALQRLQSFVKNIDTHKRPDRHRGDLPNTSLLSPHLRFGEVSARTCYFEAMKAPAHLRHGFIRRVLWRDLSYAELYRWPDMPSVSQRKQYEEQAWIGTDAQLHRWQRGQTGFPLVDAAMRQLWSQGYINNYLRHVTAGFLIDYLDISWKEGFKWYDYTLVDSDAAINARLWQQGGHSGISQWNFVLHPVYAAKNADPTGDYVRRWVPELAGLPTEFVHQPWEAPAELFALGIKLGATYPKRMVLNIEAVRKQHLDGILKVRRDHPETISKDGTERLLLCDGSSVLLRTRDDIRQDTCELIVAQAPDGVMHQKRGARTTAKASVGFQQSLIDEAAGAHVWRGSSGDHHIL